MKPSLELSRSQIDAQWQAVAAVDGLAVQLLDADLRAWVEPLIPERRTMLETAISVQSLRLLQKLCDGNDGRKESCNG